MAGGAWWRWIANRPDAPGLAFARAHGIATAVVDHKAHACARGLRRRAGRGHRRASRPTWWCWPASCASWVPTSCAATKGAAEHPPVAAAGLPGPAHAPARARGRLQAGRRHGALRDPELDHGPIVMQSAVPVLPGDDEHDAGRARAGHRARDLPAGRALVRRRQACGRWRRRAAARWRLAGADVAHAPQRPARPATDLLKQVLKLDQPADGVVSAFFRKHKALGARERHTLAETAYTVLRQRLLLQHLAQSGSGVLERRLAILAWQGSRPSCAARWPPGAAVAGTGECHRPRHAARQAAPQPARLAGQRRCTTSCRPTSSGRWCRRWPKPAPLDLRVNTLKARREDVQQALADAGIAAEPTPHSPWGLRVQGKPALNKLDVFTVGRRRGAGRGQPAAGRCCWTPSAARWWSISAPAPAARRWRWARRCATPGGCMPSTSPATVWTR
jgi:hypothetical protein